MCVNEMDANKVPIINTLSQYTHENEYCFLTKSWRRGNSVSANAHCISLSLEMACSSRKMLSCCKRNASSSLIKLFATNSESLLLRSRSASAQMCAPLSQGKIACSSLDLLVVDLCQHAAMHAGCRDEEVMRGTSHLFAERDCSRSDFSTALSVMGPDQSCQTPTRDTLVARPSETSDDAFGLLARTHTHLEPPLQMSQRAQDDQHPTSMLGHRAP